MKRKTIEIVLRGFLFVCFIFHILHLDFHLKKLKIIRHDFGTGAHREENLVVAIKTIEYLSLGKYLFYEQISAGQLSDMTETLFC